MKKNTLIAIILSLLIFPLVSQATTYTAVVSGDWSSSLTWGGNVPPDTITGEDAVVINAGVVVNMDVNVTFDNNLSSCDVIGSIQSTSHTLTIAAGTLSGTGTVLVKKLKVGAEGVVLLLGDLACDTLESSSNLLTLSTNTTVNSTLMLTAGICQISGGANLMFANNTNIHIAGGQLIVVDGMLVSEDTVNLIYSDSTSQTGGETKLDGIANVYVNLGESKDTLHMDGHLTVNDTLFLQVGRCDMNGFDLTLNGYVETHDSSSLSGDAGSNIHFNGEGDMGILLFTDTDNEVSTCNVNIAGDGQITVESTFFIQDSLKLTEGHLVVKDSTVFVSALGVIVDASDTSYVMIDGMGSLALHLEAGGDAKLFPIGTEEGYFPCIISQNPSADTTHLMARVASTVFAEGNTGVDITDTASIVDHSWFINKTESSAEVDADLRVFWHATAEVNNFNRDMCYISHYINGAWDVTAAAEARAEANSYFSIERKNIQTLSPFRVEDRLTSAINEQQAAEAAIFPNPSSQQLILDIPGNWDQVNVRIYNLKGNLVKQVDVVGGQDRISISDLPDGPYVLTLDDRKSMRFIKQ